MDYVNFAFNNNKAINDLDYSLSTFQRNWTAYVADNLKLDYNELLANYFSDTDKHDSEMRTREFYRTAASRGVTKSSTAAINGVILNEFPNDAESWQKDCQLVFAE